MTVVGRVLQHGKTREVAPAFIEGDRTISYGELATRVRSTAGHFTDLGIRHGERIGLCLKDSSTHIIALLGAALVGAVAVPLDWRARAPENLRFINALSLSRVLMEPDSSLPDDRVTVRFDEDWQRDVSGITSEYERACSWDDPFVISATSGSTGAPKFTLMTHRQYYFASAGMLELMALSGEHRFLCTLPLYYSGGRNSCIAHLLRGDCVVFYPSVFRPPEYIDVANRERITVGAVVPSTVRQLLALGANRPLLPGMAALFCSGAPLHAEEKRQAVLALTPNFNERYGTAETLAVAILRPQDFADRANSVGRPHSLVEIEIADEDDLVLPIGGVGRLRIRGPGVGSPLLDPGAATNFRNGWYYPGEIAHLDEAGYIFLRGRTSDVIIRSGAKIYPAEVEKVLLEHSDVLEAAVFGHAEPGQEELVVAFVVSRAKLQSGDLIGHCRARLTPHKVPRDIYFVSEMPRNTAGKIDKSALAARLAAISAQKGSLNGDGAA